MKIGEWQARHVDCVDESITQKTMVLIVGAQRFKNGDKTRWDENRRYSIKNSETKETREVSGF